MDLDRIKYRVVYHKTLAKTNLEISDLLLINNKAINRHWTGAIKKKTFVIEIDAEDKYKLETQLLEKFDLREVLIVDSHPDSNEIGFRIGKETAGYFVHLARDIYRRRGKVVCGIGHGGILSEMIRSMYKKWDKIRMSICTLVNDPAHVFLKGQQNRSHSLVYRLRDIFPTGIIGDLNYYCLPLDIPMNYEERRYLYNLEETQNVIRKLETSDIIMFGIGGFQENDLFYKTLMYYQEKDSKLYMNILKNNRCVGGRGGNVPIDETGKEIKTDFRYHFIGISFKAIEEIAASEDRYSILVAHGESRLKAIKATIAPKVGKRHANVLITDFETAKRLLHIKT